MAVASASHVDYRFGTIASLPSKTKAILLALDIFRMRSCCRLSSTMQMHHLSLRPGLVDWMRRERDLSRGDLLDLKQGVSGPTNLVPQSLHPQFIPR